MSMQEHAQRHYERLLNEGRKPEDAIRMVNMWVLAERLKDRLGSYTAVCNDLGMKKPQLSRYINFKSIPTLYTLGRFSGRLDVDEKVAWWEPLWGPMSEIAP